MNQPKDYIEPTRIETGVASIFRKLGSIQFHDGALKALLQMAAFGISIVLVLVFSVYLVVAILNNKLEPQTVLNVMAAWVVAAYFWQKSVGPNV